MASKKKDIGALCDLQEVHILEKRDCLLACWPGELTTLRHQPFTLYRFILRWCYSLFYTLSMEFTNDLRRLEKEVNKKEVLCILV